MTASAATAAAVRADAWLTEVIGIPVFRIDLGILLEFPTSSVAEVRRHVGGQERAFYYAKVPTDRVDLVQALAQIGLSVVEANIVFGLDPRRAPAAMYTADTVVTDAANMHADAVLEIAESSFRYTRFHLDPHISNDVANRVKREWVRSYQAGRRGERLLVATLDGRPAGFLAVLATELDGIRVRTIDLMGVAHWARRRGVGRSLVQGFIDVSRERCDILEVGTQVANIPSIQLYESVGFSVSRTLYVMHAHTGVEIHRV